MVATCFSGLFPMVGAEGPRLAPTTYYVDPGGLDTNDGSQAHPFREIRQALTKVVAGDTVLVSNGSYLGFDVNNFHGNANNWITIRAPMHNATITVTTDRGDNRDTIFITGSSFIIVDGLRSFNANRAAMRIDASNNITVRNVTFGNNAVWGIFTDFSDDTIVEDSELYGSGSQHGIYFSNSPDHPIARNNTIHDNSGCGIHMNGDESMGGDGLVQSALIEGNTIFNNGASGGSAINMDGGQDSIVRNNVLYNNHASGIANYDGDASSGPKNNEFYHNTIDMPTDGRYALQIQGSVGPVKVRNNILYNRNPNHGGLAYGDANDIANTDSDYNIMDRMTPDDWNTLLTLAQWQAQGHETHSFSSLPSQMFVDYNNRDYHLSSNSTAIDKGETLVKVTVDRDWNPRPSNVTSDIGAYEHQFPLIPDTTPPDMIIDLAASNVTHTTVDLSWTATGDDGKVGTASAYDLRYSTATITGANWASSTKYAGLPNPLPAGTKQSFKATGLTPNTKYYFAIKAIDEKNNIAALSNVVSATTLKIIPDLFIEKSGIVLNNTSPMEGNTVQVTAYVRAINITEKITFFVEMRVDDVPAGNQSVALNDSSIIVVFNWTSIKGQHNISIVLDTAKAIQETDETNNTATKAITVKSKPVPPRPDLSIVTSDIAFSKNEPIAEDLVNISVVVHAANVTHNITFRVDLFVDDVPDGFELIDIYASTLVVKLKWAAIKGVHTITFIVDTGNDVNESCETNNRASRNITVGSPDIYIDISDISFPGRIWYEGDVVPVEVTIHLINVQMGKPFAWKATIDDHFYHNERMDEWYTSGTTLPGWFDWKSAVPGTHNITVQLDTTNVFDEDNETNNIATRKITILKKVVNSNPDLRISEAEIALPSEAMTDGDKVTFGAIVHAANLTHTINVTVEMLVDNILIEKLVTPMSQDAFSVWFNWTAVKGQHNVTFRVIPEQGITETDKTNNIATKAFSVQAPPKKPHHDNMTATYAIIGVVIAAVIAGIVGWFIVSKRKKKEKDPQ
jgi:hypothetical protein